MSYKNDAIARRAKILEFLVKNKETTRTELAKEFHVCVNTIVNDLYSIEKFAPVYTKQGKGGGIYILPEYKSNRNYLTDIEENLLYHISERVDKNEKKILIGIIIKFTRNPLRIYNNL